MCNEVGEEACGLREVLRGLVWNGECELEFIFILDRLYENCALVVPRSVRNLKNWKQKFPPVVGLGSMGHL